MADVFSAKLCPSTPVRKVYISEVEAVEQAYWKGYSNGEAGSLVREVWCAEVEERLKEVRWHLFTALSDRAGAPVVIHYNFA